MRPLALGLCFVTGFVVLSVASGCTWARIRKQSAGDIYVCGWPDEASKVGPLQCVPFEDFDAQRRAHPVRM